MKKTLLHPLCAGILSGALLCLGVPAVADTFPLSPDSDVVGELRIIIAKHEDTLSDLARRHDLGYNEIVDANPTVDPWLPGAGTPIVLPTQFILPNAARQGIVLNVATMRLFYYPPAKPGEQAVVITHPIGIGKEGWSTPIGTTQIIAKQKDPAWNVPVSIREEHAKKGDPLPAIVPPGPDNPLGQFAMRLGLPGYLIHGTNKPYGIGMRVSHGCIHLYPEDIAELFETIPVGVAVNIINKPYTAGWHNNMLYIEAHTPLEEDAKVLDGSLTPALKEVVRATKAEDRANINWSRLIRVAHRHPGFPVPISMNAPSLSDMFEALSVINEETGSAIVGSPVAPLAVTTAGQTQTADAGVTPIEGTRTPATAPLPEPLAAAASVPVSTNWYIQAGTFQREDNAQRLTFQLREMEPAITAQYVSSSSGHRVLAGPFNSRDEAQNSQNRIKAQLGIQTLIKPVAGRRNSN